MENCIQIYNHKEHSYTIILEKNNKEYIGIAICSPDEYKKESELFGFSLAELRANIIALKDSAQEKRKELKILNDFYSSLKCYKDFNDDSLEARKIRRQLYIKTREYNELLDTIAFAKANVNKAINDLVAAEGREEAKKARLELLKEKLQETEL